jgi:hypothetical protein
MLSTKLQLLRQPIVPCYKPVKMQLFACNAASCAVFVVIMTAWLSL